MSGRTKRKAATSVGTSEESQNLPDGKGLPQDAGIAMLGPQRKRRQASKVSEGANAVDETKPTKKRTYQRARKVKQEDDTLTPMVKKEEDTLTPMVKKEEVTMSQCKDEIFSSAADDNKLEDSKCDDNKLEDSKCDDNKLENSKSNVEASPGLRCVQSSTSELHSPDKKSRKRVPIQPGSLKPPNGWRDIYDLVTTFV